MSPSSAIPTPLSAHPNSEGYVQQFQIQLPGGPQTPSSRATSAYQYGGPSGVRASVACDACRKRKVKCTVVHAQTPLHPLPGQEPPPRVCARCSRLGIDCSWKDEKKTGKPRAKVSAQSLEVVFESYPNQGPNGYVYVPPSPPSLPVVHAHILFFLHAIRRPSWTNHYLSCQFVNHLVHISPETLCASNLAFLEPFEYIGYGPTNGNRNPGHRRVHPSPIVQVLRLALPLNAEVLHTMEEARVLQLIRHLLLHPRLRHHEAVTSILLYQVCISPIS